MRCQSSFFGGGLYGFFLAYLASPVFGWHLDTAHVVDFVHQMPDWVKYAGKAIVAAPFAFHSLNGVRHIVWDLTKGAPYSSSVWWHLISYTLRRTLQPRRHSWRVGSCWWDCHLDDCSSPPLVDVIYPPRVKYIGGAFIGFPSHALEQRPRSHRRSTFSPFRDSLKRPLSFRFSLPAFIPTLTSIPAGVDFLDVVIFRRKPQHMQGAPAHSLST